MHRLNTIFTLSSLSVLLVTIERFSFTAKILLQPYNFLRLHELIQMTVIILITVVLPFFLFREVTNNFETIKNKGFFLALLFIIGIYFYATGNGLHEVSSFNFNNFCDPKNFSSQLCKELFFNDYYTGNILYFLGGGLMVVSLMLLELLKPNQTFQKKDFKITVINAVVYALAIFAYAAFDVVSVGIIYSIIIAAIATYLFLKIKNGYLNYPIITYTFLTYLIGTLAALIVRFHLF